MSGLRRCLAAVVAAAALVGCTSSSPTAEGSSTTTATLYEDGGRVTDDAGLVPLADWNARQDAFLQKATATPMDPTKPVSLMAYGARARRDPTRRATP